MAVLLVLAAPFVFADLVRDGYWQAAIVSVVLGFFVGALYVELRKHKARQAEAARIRAFIVAFGYERLMPIFEQMFREAPVERLQEIGDALAKYGKDAIRIALAALDIRALANHTAR